jgi:ribonuclease HII
VIGIDEVGRGPIAGPVAVGAFVILKAAEVKRGRFFHGVKESKQLSPEAREEWFIKIKKARRIGLVDFSVAFQSAKIIDAKGISYAIRKALAISIEKLKINPAHARVLLDGGLQAPAHFENQKTIIRGDGKETAIALASITAKVLRDRRMVAFSKKHPGYGFEVHKGYGTKAHYRAIKKYGFSSLHRCSFLRKLSGKLAKNR